MEKRNKDKIKIVIKSICIVAVIILFCLQFYEISQLNSKLEILGARIYSIEKTKEEDKYAHLSIDDTFEIFEDLIKNGENYDSIFQNRVLQYLRDLHTTYGIVVSCYCWYEDNVYNLSMVTDRFADEFQENSDWLRFGFHAYDRDIKYENDEQSEEILSDYNQVINELIRITGGTNSIDNVPRLHYYAGTKQCVDAIKNTDNGIKGLLTADEAERNSYYFNAEENDYLYTHDLLVKDGLTFINTDFRMENYDDIQPVLDNYAEEYATKKIVLEFFTHEWKLNDSMVKENIEKCCYFAVENSYSWDFPEDRI